MTLQTIKQIPLRLPAAPKTEVRAQFGGLCYRMRDGEPEILLVTGRGSGRWTIPKGWPMPGRTPTAMVQKEAWDEAGVRGIAHSMTLGLYSHTKEVEPDRGLSCLVMIYPVLVKSLADAFTRPDSAAANGRAARRPPKKWTSPNWAYHPQLRPPQAGTLTCAGRA